MSKKNEVPSSEMLKEKRKEAYASFDSSEDFPALGKVPKETKKEKQERAFAQEKTSLQYKLRSSRTPKEIAEEEIRMDALGKTLSQILRHRAADLKLNMWNDGYVKLSDLRKLDITTRAKVSLSSHSVGDYREVVRRDTKQRFSLREDVVHGLLIRANQGHSIETVQSEALLTPITSAAEVPICVHGTYNCVIGMIMKFGLKPMGRNHVHFATGLPENEGIISGMRASSEWLIHLNVEKALQDGMKLYKSQNNVILTEGLNGVVHPKYFKVERRC